MEIFVATRSRAYREYNFSPSGEWAAYRFSSYRNGMRRDRRRPAFHVHRQPGALIVNARVPAASGVGLSAVVEDRNGRLSYWALRHPRAKPDFHDRRGFALRMK